MKNLPLIIFLLLIGVTYVALSQRNEINKCREANNSMKHAVEVICSLPIVECGSQEYFNQKDAREI